MQRGNTFTSYQSILDALDQEPALTNLPTIAHLNRANLYSEALHEELQQYQHTDRMVEALRQAGLLEARHSQVLNSLLFACKTIKLRSEHKSTRNHPPLDEHAELADFMESMAAKKSLSVNVCKVVFGDITWQQKLSRLQELFNSIDFLTEPMVEVIMTHCFSYLDLYELMKAIDHTNDSFRFLFSKVNLGDHEIIRNCLLGYNAHHYREWLDEDLLIMGMQAPLKIHALCKGWHLLHQAGKLHQHYFDIAADIHNSHHLELLHEADLLNADYVSLVIHNDAFADAVHLLKDAKLLGPVHHLFDSRTHPRYRCFNATDGRLIVAALLCHPAQCSRLIHYSRALAELSDHETYFNAHRNLMLRLIDDMLPANIKFHHRSPPRCEKTAETEAVFAQVTAILLKRAVVTSTF